MKKFAEKIIRQAGKELKKEFWQITRSDVRYKSKYQIVTKADLIAEKIILSAIRKKFPDHHILSEEAGDNKKRSDYLWIVDPLDGTTNFNFKNPLFGTQLALAYKNEVTLGVIYVPFLDLMFVAEKGQGVTMNGKKIKVSAEKKLNGSFLAYCHGSKMEDVKRAVELYKGFKIKHSDIRQLGAASVELAWTAAGYLDAYFIPGALPWDVAPGSLMVREAGGRVTDFKGKEWNLKSPDVLASNGKIHQQLLKEIKKYDI